MKTDSKLARESVLGVARIKDAFGCQLLLLLLLTKNLAS